MPKQLAPVARRLRRNSTDAERRLWRGLRQKQVDGFRFRRQVVLGGFIADFASFDARLVIEVDGATHSTEAELARDAARTAGLADQGFALIRFTNDEVYANLEGVLEAIRLKLMELRPRIQDSATLPINLALRDPPSCPSPTRGEGTPATDAASFPRWINNSSVE